MQKKIAIDYLVNNAIYPNRSRAIEAAIAEKIDDYRRKRFDIECANLNPKEEQEFAEWGGFKVKSKKSKVKSKIHIKVLSRE